MTLSGLVDLLATEPQLSEALGLARGGAPALDLATPPSSRAAIAATLARHSDRMVLLVASTFREAEDLASSLESWLSPDEVCYYPAWETLPHERLSPRSDTVGRRLEVLRRITGREQLPPPRVVVTAVRSLLQPQARGLAELMPVVIEKGAELDPGELAHRLVDAAYTRVDLVERRGEFAVRGGIVDLFAPTEELPVRIDFFGDEVEEIRHFSIADQRSAPDALDRVVASPCRELLLNDAVRDRARALIPEHPELVDMLDRIAEGQAVEGMEALTPVLADGLEMLVDVLPATAMVLLSDPELVRSRAQDLVRTSHEFLEASWSGAAGGGRAPINLDASAYKELGEVRSHVLSRGQSWWSLSSFTLADTDSSSTEDNHVSTDGVESLELPIRQTEPWRGDVDGAVADFAEALSHGARVVLTVDGPGLGSRMKEVLGEHDLPARVVDEVAEAPEQRSITIVPATQRHGFRADGLGLVVFTTGDLSSQQVADKSARKMPSRRKNQIEPLELKAGDPVVHEHHGVGRYVEMTTRTVQGATREYLVIEYAPSKRGQPGDRLFVPMDSLDLVTRYVGGENPALDRMGGADWRQRKSRARKAVKEIAAELIKLYAARQASRGHAFSSDTVWQRELEDAFAYVETPDQLATLQEVKKDMEQVVPMDRLVCGDVGYGKTEIAVRAAFKAVQDGKQVAVLVPTTLLAQQHFQTFSDRYAGFPVHVAAMSRFQSDKEIAQVKDGLSSGKVDVVVGTHRLFGSDVVFKDLGLVIVDEEQRFGVEHKEALKKLRLNVDVLSMSATPIPRTLEMAITGIREMSTIATPPEERHPVLTFAGPYDEGQVTAAIRRELAREGQVFFVHNRVQSIEKTAKRIRELVPEARVVTAHGQMGEAALEQVMVDFWERRADVLVSTTIVEAGIDISTANTLIIDRADRMGLSQLHQIRGRVGRGRERGYAYFLYPPDKPLTEAAHDRLATMAAHTDLGAGMAIAMKDLEIRGAGNLLGGEQSGHIADVGFDLYIRLVGEAVANFRGEDVEEEPDMRIELPVDAHLPTDYVESERLRLEMYKRLAEVRTTEDIDEVATELRDRYGEFGAQVQALLDVAAFRLLCRERGISEVTTMGNNVRIAPASLPESRELRLNRLYPGSTIKKALNVVLVPRPRISVIEGLITDNELLEWLCTLVRDIFPVTVARTVAEGSEEE
ncbi:transcription-repair coupling factor [Aestuariimicrobium sp. p3-SID1156]|uniref:transcription-repair coupling factor n=1 Tax=Aestuariimicrobium sp. p3-SID1156 TaxID=2916038 RepID=UPI00223BB36E|nr:transcription-repair coupling factor [Aestuariimicrobium sp. p3-SID1156]MCT1458814.1 transcription-repair coupling factor [Aestuariimicrobium sp. p3-SID1156]